MTFQEFYDSHVLNVRFFSANEFLYRGANDATLHLNTAPPQPLWPNMVLLAHVLDAGRFQLQCPLSLTSIYRSPAYNRAIKGSQNSLHMKFCAADIQCPDHITTGTMAVPFYEMRQKGFFEGGIGLYNSFIHVDTRGVRADWDKR